MPLDLAQVVSQIKGLAARLKAGERERGERLEGALTLLSTTDIEPLISKTAASKTTWLVAGLIDGLDLHHEVPPSPSEFTVLATDGSHIDVDRHSSVPCCLINIGGVILHYGKNPDASLSGQPALFSGDELLIVDPVGGNREEIVQGPLLGVKRSVEELSALSRLAHELPVERSTLALVDGSLILWGLAGQTFPEFVKEALLEKEFLRVLDGLKGLSRDGKFAVASYISFPRSADVVNALRLALCPHEVPDCDRYCPGRRAEGRECDAVSGVQDRELFEALLEPGERSATFASRSSIVRKYYGDHEIHFFYLKVDGEVARVELPRWVAESDELVGLAHSLILDQCRRGHGYPVALMEAHEKAVVTTADRERFWELVELSLHEDGLPLESSGKSRSKRTRWV